MSEYMEKHAVARLIGAPPGYVGFEQGGLLVDAVRQHPYAVLLLDEIEKAHPDLFNILLQVMDHATLTDNNGRKADFRQVVLIMTSNAGSRELSAGTIGFWESGASARAVDARQKAAEQRSKHAVEKVFSPEFRNRLDAIVTFGPLSPGVMSCSSRRNCRSGASRSRSIRPHGRGSPKRATTRFTAPGRSPASCRPRCAIRSPTRSSSASSRTAAP
jgi:ATP-dependent Clp protease ATP-binding subunit ClpA